MTPYEIPAATRTPAPIATFFHVFMSTTSVTYE
jgi:hypothetical protein